MPKTVEITAIFYREKFRKEDWVIVQAMMKLNGGSDPITITATAEVDELVPNLSYRFYGSWENHARFGRQFKAKTFIRCQPHGQAGTIRYLTQAPGVGNVIAQALWKKFQGDAVRILRESPDVAAAAVDKLSLSKAKEAAEYLRGEQELEGCAIDLIDLLGGQGFPKATAKKAVRKWGNRAAEIIRHNPYLLMQFHGCGFLRCDKLYLQEGYDPVSKQGNNPARLKRQALCAWHALASDNNGHTWHPVKFVEEALRAKISGANVNGPAAILLARRAGIIATRRDSKNRLWLAEARRAEQEQIVAEKLTELSQHEPMWPEIDAIDISDHQRTELARALTSAVGILGGSPGTGKTYVIARIVAKIIAEHGHGSIAVVAPTGKATVRVTEAMQGYGVNVQATTVHRLLEVEKHEEGSGWSFRHNEENPLDFQFVVCDETSMVGCGLFASFLRAISPGTQLLLVGDINQLPPVEHGAPLRDMIAAGMATGDLRKIRRNAGTIVRACHAIRDGQRFEVDKEINPAEGRNLKLLKAGVETATDRIVAALGNISNTGLDPVWDCQVIVAVNEKSNLSRKKMNQRLQVELNPAGKGVVGSPFRAGDKIICLQNGFVPIDEERHEGNDDDGKVFVANGEIGRVIEAAEKVTIVRLDAPRRVVKIFRSADKGDDAGCSFDLAYAVTCHKLQGSEVPVTFVVLDEYYGAKMVCQREWVYTAISRAKVACFLVGRLITAQAMCVTPALAKRKTFLRELIEGELASGTEQVTESGETIEPPAIAGKIHAEVVA